MAYKIYSSNIKFRTFLLLGFIITGIIEVLYSCNTESHWLRGNMHTHTFWSDGDDFPEIATKWYKENGYDFLVLTDHNVILEGDHWRRFSENDPIVLKYIEICGDDWVETRPDNEEGFQQVRLKPLKEFRSMYEDPDSFLLIMGNEISSSNSVHILTYHMDTIIPASRGNKDERSRMIGEVVARVDKYRLRTGLNIYPVLAHPNFTWAITAEMILDNPSLRFFEVYNGHPKVNNDGDDFRASTDRIWDIVLANRLIKGGSEEVIYGLATDDTHNYHGDDAGPGKGWVMVRSKKLTPESILNALDKGDFYASTGVSIRDIKINHRAIKIEIEPQEGVKYLTEFIGTRKGFDPSNFPTLDSSGAEILNTSRTYSDQIGEVFARSESTNPSYSFSGNELYVRIRIKSSADHKDPITGKVLGKQRAWIQPIVQRKK